MLSEHFKGQSTGVEEVGEYVIADTPFYKFKTEALKPMEASRQILVTSTDPKRKKGTFPEGKTQIRFLWGQSHDILSWLPKVPVVRKYARKADLRFKLSE